MATIDGKMLVVLCEFVTAAGLLRMRAIEYEMGRHRPWHQPKPTRSAFDYVPTEAHFLEVAEEGRVRQGLVLAKGSDGVKLIDLCVPRRGVRFLGQMP